MNVFQLNSNLVSVRNAFHIIFLDIPVLNRKQDLILFYSVTDEGDGVVWDYVFVYS